MKKLLFSLAMLISTPVIFHLKAQSQEVDSCYFFDTVVNNHNQIFQLSCIPSAVEMVLKYYKVVDFDYYDLQNEWKNKADGFFRDFDNKEIYGFTFSQRFVMPRYAHFTIYCLIQTIYSDCNKG